VSFGLALLRSQVPLVVAGGRCRSGASRGTWVRTSPQDAASRSAYGTSPEDALDERDATTIRTSKQPSNYFGAMSISLMIAAAKSVSSRAAIAKRYAQDIHGFRAIAEPVTASPPAIARVVKIA
jgi:hypothetical protein